MAELNNVFLLAGDAVLYFVALAALLRARRRIGLGAFFCALGVMHFLETYLAGILYVALPFGIVTSPGSTVLFTGKLMMLLLLYIREDAVVVPSQVPNRRGEAARFESAPIAPPRQAPRPADVEMVAGRPVHVVYRPSRGLEVREPAPRRMPLRDGPRETDAVVR